MRYCMLYSWYAWADGIYLKAGLEKDKAAALVVLGAMSDGRKQVLVVRPGHRESTESWLSVLRELRDRGLRAPVLMMADGALPILSAVDQVWPETSQQRCWNHKIINVLDNDVLESQFLGDPRAAVRGMLEAVIEDSFLDLLALGVRTSSSG